MSTVYIYEKQKYTYIYIYYIEKYKFIAIRTK